MKYPCRRLTTLARVGGAGFRVLAKFNHTRSAHYERVVAMYTKTRLPFDLWLGRGRPLNPYFRGVIIDLLRKEMRPKELSLIREDQVPRMRDFLEWSTLRAWVRDWLQYCCWYYGTAMSPEVSIEQFFDVPIVNTKWKVDRTDPHLVRFGLLWRIFDLVALKGLDFQLPILGSRSGTYIGYPYLLGGLTGADFLVSALGVNQPRAGRGVISPGAVVPFGTDPSIRHIRYKMS
jgi:hypothetical protein